MRQAHGVSLFIVLCACLMNGGQALAQDFSVVPGVVINYEESPAYYTIGSTKYFTEPKVYLSTPSITIMPNGDYFVSNDYFGAGTNEDTVKVFRSTDKGQTWTQTATINQAFWSTIFQHNGDLYLWGYYEGGDNGDIVIRKSTDNGVTWTNPTSATTGLLKDGNYGGTANSPVIYNNRIWIAQGGNRVMSAPVNANLLLASSWTLSTGASTSATPLGSGLTITEAQVIASPQTGVAILPKIGGLPNTVILRVNPNNPGQMLNPAASDYVDLPGGEKKFGATYDPVSGKFYVLDNPVLPAHASHPDGPALVRNTAAVLSSKDLYHWDVEKIFLYSDNPDHEAFQYFNFAIDGDDLAVASRTGYVIPGENPPPRGHDSNLITFHTIEDFRSLTPTQVLIADSSNNRVLRYEATQTNEMAPLGSFALGTTLNNPVGIAQGPDSDVYISEQADGGRILRFDAMGNLKGVVATEGVNFAGRAEAMTVGPDGKLYVTIAFNTTNDKVLKIDPDTGSVTTFIDTNFGAGTLVNPRGITFADDGNLYVADRESDHIRKFDGTTGAFIEDLTSTGQPYPQALDWDEENNRLLYSRQTTTGDFDIARVLLNGSVLTLYTATDIGNAVDIEAVDGRVFWSDFDNNHVYVSLSEPDKTKADSIITGLNHPTTIQSVTQAAFGERSWVNTAAGDWTDPLNWYYWGRPDTDYEVATFGSAIGANTTVTLDENYIVKGLRFRDNNTYTLGGTGSLTLAADVGRAILDVAQGTHNINLALTLADDTDVAMALNARLNVNGDFDLAGKTLDVTGPGRFWVFNTFVMNGGTIVTDGAAPFSFAATINPTLNGTFRFEYDGPLAENDSFDILNGTGYLTTTFNQVFLPELGPRLIWDATGFYDNGVVTVIKYLLTGDANADGVVDAADYVTVENYFGATGTSDGSLIGDANFDGRVDGADWLAIDRNFGSALPVLGPQSVPEPAALSLLALGSIVAAGRRRHR